MGGGLRTERLAETHAGLFHDLCVDEHVRRFLLDGQRVPRSWAHEEITRSDALFEARGVGLWLLVGADGPAGFCGFRHFPELGPEPQLLYALRERHTGRGLATEAVTWLLEHVRARGWQRVEAAVDAPNVASARVLEKCRFVGCGHVPGGFGDTVLFERWLAPSESRMEGASGSRYRIEVASQWNAAPARSEERVAVELQIGDDELRLRVQAPWHGDAAPASAPGATDRLWEHEVVELMLLGDDERYLEIELGPLGHYLVLVLQGRRRIVHQGLLMHYAVERRGAEWLGEARVPLSWIPPHARRVNAFAIHGEGSARRHLTWRPAGGTQPDFHQLDSFGALAECQL